jgi:hypothetical protein
MGSGSNHHEHPPKNGKTYHQFRGVISHSCLDLVSVMFMECFRKEL